MLNKIYSQTGSTLIEVLVSVVIVGVVLTAIAATLSLTVKNSSQADFRQVATRCAQEKMEEQRKQRAESWSTFNQSDRSATPTAAGSCTLNDPQMTFERFMTKTYDSVNDTVTVVITVEWPDGGSQRDVEIEQKFFNY